MNTLAALALRRQIPTATLRPLREKNALNSPDLVRYVLAAVLGLFFIAMAGANIWMKVRSYRTGKFISVIPLLGGLAGLLAMLIVPIDLRRWCWLPLVLDPGCLILILAVPYIAWYASRPVPRAGPPDEDSDPTPSGGEEISS